MVFDMRIDRLLVLLFAFGAACGPNENDDGGDGATNGEEKEVVDEAADHLDDPDARQWHRAGGWYPDDFRELDQAIARHVAVAESEPRSALGIVVPHAALKYSGDVQGAVYGAIETPDVVVLFAPKHHQEGESPAIWDAGPFLVPGHAMEIRHDLVEDLSERIGDLPTDRAAFEEPTNHPTEMQLPFISFLNPDAELVPITVYDRRLAHFHDFDLDRIKQWGEALAAFVEDREAAGESVLIVVSTDLVHHLPLSVSDEQDPVLMDLTVSLDVEGLYEYVTEEEVTICGEIPTAILMETARILGRTDAELLARDSSYSVTENEEKVVGYGGAAFWN